MADRVAGSLQQGAAEQILGVTFTRKRQGHRARRGQTPHSSALTLRRTDSSEPFGEPMIAIYHSYAQSLVREHGLRLASKPMPN